MDQEVESSESFLETLLLRKLEKLNVDIEDKVVSSQEEAAVHFINLLERTKGLAAIKTAVVHPTDKESLAGAIMAAELGIIEPTLIGPEHKIVKIAKEYNYDLKNYKIINVEHSHQAAEKGVELAHNCEASAVMKGSLHTDELMAEVVDKDKGLRTERRISHAFLMSVSTFHKPFIITDAAINIRPSLSEKRDILQNSIDLMHTLEVSLPKVAILSAVETINEKIPATIDEASLSKMADRGQINGAIVDGPLAFDNAISIAAAETKGIHSKVSENADILLVPDLESGNMLAKQLKYLSNALMAGIVLGTRVPVILTSRSDPMDMRVIACVLAALMIHNSKLKL